MNFNIYLDEQTGKRLARVAAKSHKSRNALIRDAVRGWLAVEGKAVWPDIVLAFEGVKRIEHFESHRERLRAPARDPLA